MAEKGKGSELEKEFPLHWCVWHNNLRTLNALLESKEQRKNTSSSPMGQDVCQAALQFGKESFIIHDIEKPDPRGRTPIHLAISMGHLECTKSLLRHDADANKENSKYWTALHEATSTGDPELVQSVLQYRDYQRYMHRTDGIPALLRKIREAPDFYVEMTWEFTSWVPLVSRMCPSDTYKVYKSGSMVRIDTTLLGFDGGKWERGSRTYVFKADTDCAKVIEIDHDAGIVYCETIKEITVKPSIDYLLPSTDQVSARLTSPVVTTYVNTEKIEFERAKQGVWGFRSDKVENVNGYECKVFNASNVQFITKTRLEHLSAQDKKQAKKNKSSLTPLENFLGLAERHTEKSPQAGDECVDTNNPCSITPEEYFDSSIDLKERDIGRPRETATKIQKFKASLSLCEDYPLTLQEQVLPIIDLMAATNPHFRKLKEFITLQLPAGFPVKIEIPIFHVINARITFGNIYSSDAPVDRVSVIKDTTQREDENGETVFESVVSSCAVDETVFDSPQEYRIIKILRRCSNRPHSRPPSWVLYNTDINNNIDNSADISVTDGTHVAHKSSNNHGDSGSHNEDRYVDQDDQLLQFAIQQSLMESETAAGRETSTAPKLNFTEALQSFSQENSSPHPTRNDRTSNIPNSQRSTGALDYDSQLAMVLEMSKQQVQSPQPSERSQEEVDLERQEQEELEKILALSLVEK